MEECQLMTPEAQVVSGRMQSWQGLRDQEGLVKRVESEVQHGIVACGVMAPAAGEMHWFCAFEIRVSHRWEVTSKTCEYGGTLVSVV